MDRDALWLWFTENFGFSSNKTNKLLEQYNSIDGLFKIPEMLLMEDKNFTLKQKKEIIICDLGPYKRRIKNLLSKGIHVISIDNPLYPQILKNIANPPYVLYACGKLEELNHSYPITVVGPREPDEFGINETKRISDELSKAGALIVSGLAKGCDKLSHEGALNNNGATIGICACGLEVDYPKGSGPFKRLICQNGCVISEFPPKFPVRSFNFAMRNRLLSGLSLATIVVEGTLKSGTLLTANYAANQNRDVYVVKGDENNPLSAGPRALLEDGAAELPPIEEFIAHYREIYEKPLVIPKKEIKKAPAADKPNINKAKIKETPKSDAVIKKKDKNIPDDIPEEEKEILSHLKERPLQIDELVLKTGFPSHKLLSYLTELELFSLVKALPGGMYEALL